MIVFSDFECPYCAQFARETLPALREAYVSKGRLRVAFNHFPLPMHRSAKRAAVVAECADGVGLFWPMHDDLFQNMDRLDEPTILERAVAVGIEDPAFSNCLKRNGSDRINRHIALGQSIGVRATPTFMFGIETALGFVKVDSVLTGARPFGEFQSRIDRLLRAGDE